MKSLLAVLAALQLLAVGVGCQDNWQSFYISRNMRLGDPPTCQLPTDESATGLVAGTVDVGVRLSYVAYLFVKNALIARADEGLPRAESNGIFIQGAYLDYEPDPACPGIYPSTEARFASYLAPGKGLTIGTELIPASVGLLMANSLATCSKGFLDVTVTVQLYGVTQAGTDVLTQPFDYPITYCDGCLTYFPIGMTDGNPALPGLQCNCADSSTPLADTPCQPGQDDPIDCRLTSICY